MGKLGAGDREEHEHEREPEPEEELQVAPAGAPDSAERPEEEARVGKQDQQDHRNEVPEGSPVPVHGIGEPVEVVPQEEAVDEGLAIPEVHRHVPGCRNGQEDGPSHGVEYGPEVAEELPSHQGQEEGRRQGDRYRDRPLGQEPQGRPEKDPVQGRPPRVLPESVEVEEGEGQEEIQERVGCGGPADDHDPEGGGGDHTCRPARGVVPLPPGEPPDHQHPQDRRQSRVETHPPLVPPQEAYAYGLDPVGQDGLVVAGLPVQGGGDVVAALQHLPGGFAEGPLVPVEEGCIAQVHEERQGHGKGQEEEGPSPRPEAQSGPCASASGLGHAGGSREVM